MASDPQLRSVPLSSSALSARLIPPRLSRRGLLAVAAGGAGLVLSGCGGTEASVLEAGDTPVEGGTLRVGLGVGGVATGGDGLQVITPEEKSSLKEKTS